MIKKLTLLLAATFSIMAAKAQDTAHADISVALDSPAPNVVIPYGDTAHLSFTYTNHGPDVLPAGDTLFFVASGGIVLYSKLLMDLPVNSGITMNDVVYYFNPTEDSIHLDVCIVHIPQSSVQYTGGSHPATTYVDNDTTNDMSCVSIILDGPTVGIGDRKVVAEALTLYPNPATDQLYADFSAQGSKELKAVVKDIAGRVVSVKMLQSRSGAGVQKYGIDVSGLHPGIYFLELGSGEKTARGKFVIAR